MIHIHPEEIEITAARARRLECRTPALRHSRIFTAERDQGRLLSKRGRRITSEGVIIIKAQRFRTLEQNRDDALARLQDIVDSAAVTRPPRKATRPTQGSQRRRVDEKVRRGKIKATRRRLDVERTGSGR